MKSTKKLLALLLSAILLLSLLPAAFATAPEAPVEPTYSLTIKHTLDGRQYELYQIFRGALHTDEHGNKILSDVVYGASWANQTEGAPVPENILNEYVAGDGKANIDKFLPNKKDTAFRTVKAVGTGVTSATFENLPAGYYFVQEVGELTGQNAKSEHIIQVVGNTEVAAKMDVPTSQKKVKDTNDSTGETTGWQDSADYDIGDKVPFQLTAEVAQNILNFKGPYALTFHDKQSAGLTFNPEDVKVMIDGTLVTTGYTVVTGEDITDGCTFHVKFNDLKVYKEQRIHGGSVVTVEYTSTLNENAQIGSVGNPNEMHITFSNNPNSDQPEENGETPNDKVIVFTFQLDVFKLDGSSNPAGKPMAGAEFTLYKKNTGNEFVPYKVITPDKADGSDNQDGIKHVYHFKGLDDGTYKLVETVTPQGYNTADPIEFTITAEHDVISDDPKLTSLSGDNTIILNVGAVTSGIFTTYVQNFKGNTLPSTGGMGTTVFYVLGSILAVGAAILLVSKKRMNGAR